MNNYDREALKEFAKQGGLINIIYRNLPNKAVMQDGEIEVLAEKIYGLISDSRMNSVSPDRIYEHIKSLGNLLDTPVDVFCQKSIITIDEVAMHMDNLFIGLFNTPEIADIQWISPTSLFITSKAGTRTQKCRIDVFARDMCISTTIADLELKSIQQNLGDWLQKLHKLLIASQKLRYAVSPALSISSSHATITAGVHIPGDNLNIYDVLFYTKRLVDVGDELEKIFNTEDSDKF